MTEDIVNYFIENSDFYKSRTGVILDMLLAGFVCVKRTVKDLQQEDELGRPFRDIELEHIPYNQVILDPLSKRQNYSDARFIHVIEPLRKDELYRLFPDKKTKINKLSNMRGLGFANYATIDSNISEHHTTSTTQDIYYLVTTEVRDDDDVLWEIVWCGEDILSKQKLEYHYEDYSRFTFSVVKSSPYLYKTEFSGMLSRIKVISGRP